VYHTRVTIAIYYHKDALEFAAYLNIVIYTSSFIALATSLGYATIGVLYDTFIVQAMAFTILIVQARVKNEPKLKAFVGLLTRTNTEHGVNTDFYN
jgi:hypothetical protein